ncbi:MAG: RNA polymerase sigma-70 factor [Balneolaceae bacterium]|nr:RNA polymerase sigma-70 factor [Balneolaceae bacterium]MBO6545098.1 RNA polymerase sigma-70 factor [Balneolaceae bacterium]MBO6646494.1 RNA polymerase sigma-70 factor [Balneolaceae bacterium]
MYSESENQFTEKEFRELYLNYYPIIFKVAVYILKEEEAAEDTVQEIFIKLWENPSLLSGVEYIKSYLISMTKNLAFDKLKAQKKESEHILQLEKTMEEDELIEEENFRKALEKVVSELPPKCRLIFSLSRFEGLSNDEIADYLQISKRTVETQISLALKAFRGDLRPILKSYLPGGGMSFLTLFLQQL